MHFKVFFFFFFFFFFFLRFPKGKMVKLVALNSTRKNFPWEVDKIKGAFVWDQSRIRIIGIMRVSICFGSYSHSGIPGFLFLLFCS